jgi:hypothetical protein
MRYLKMLIVILLSHPFCWPTHVDLFIMISHSFLTNAFQGIGVLDVNDANMVIL